MAEEKSHLRPVADPDSNGEAVASTGSAADRIVDEILPDGLDWRHLVRSYPLPAVAVAALGGFLIGRKHGTFLWSSAASFAVREVSSNISSLFDAQLGEDAGR